MRILALDDRKGKGKYIRIINAESSEQTIKCNLKIRGFILQSLLSQSIIYYAKDFFFFFREEFLYFFFFCIHCLFLFWNLFFCYFNRFFNYLLFIFDFKLIFLVLILFFFLLYDGDLCRFDVFALLDFNDFDWLRLLNAMAMHTFLHWFRFYAIVEHTFFLWFWFFDAVIHLLLSRLLFGRRREFRKGRVILAWVWGDGLSRTRCFVGGYFWLLVEKIYGSRGWRCL